MLHSGMTLLPCKFVVQGKGALSLCLLSASRLHTFIFAVEDMYLDVEDSGQVIDVRETDTVNKNLTKVAFTGKNDQQIAALVLKMFD
jgi:hypothetical protein